jgi:hypothetical protein
VGGKSSGGSGAGGKTTGGAAAGGGKATGGAGVDVGGATGAGGKATGGAGVGGAAGGGKATGGAGGGVGGTGAKATGGTATNGGTTSVNTAAGGAGGGDLKAFVEDPGADCTVGAMPAVSSLTANKKLPDPFKKMDGTAMTTKKEWRCRREEILQEGWQFIYGKKPRTPKSAVTGTVSSSQVSITVNDGGKSTTMKFSISVPTSGKAPYPAVLDLGGTGFYMNATAKSEFTSKGVAVITYDAYSVGSESPAQTGYYYNVYSDKSVGLLMAWAWGASRIIDVLEQNPTVIDPTKVAVTGCSRFGKGAFVTGAFDSRIALTIPMESGVGGTPALRLIEQLDSYSGSEWPYHAISYEPWFSPSLLGQFTKGNDATNDNTDKLPVDMHEMLALIVPRGLYIWDNPSTNYNGLDRNSAYATASIAAKIFDALGVKSNFTYTAASGSHCAWRDGYRAGLVASIQKFLLGDSTAATGTFTSDLGGTKPTPDSYMDFTIPTLSGDL